MSTVSGNTLFLLLVVCLSGSGFNMLCQGYREEERTALLEIKNSINNPEGTALSDWYGQDCCQWDGVECNVSTSRVIKITISYERDEGLSDNWYPNASSFSQFEDLQELQLPGNHIAGFIMPKALQKLKNLQKLDLEGNSLDGSRLCWGKLRSLYHLDLSDNKLHGDIPSCVCESHSLTHLYLSNNQLQGNIDACLSQLSSLEILHLSSNDFNGSFPSLLFRNMTTIESLVASQNQFNGVVSLSIFANLSKLTRLDISSNHDLVVETEFPTWSPSFQLHELFLGGCNLNNHSGNKIPSFISSQYHLQSLDLSDNSLVGNIPSWWLYNVSRLLLRGNMFNGSFPQPYQYNSSKIALLDISNNLFYGPIPANIDIVFPMLKELNAAVNGFKGSIPPSFGEIKQLRSLDLSNNHLDGEISYSMTSNMTSLEHLGLSDNNLQGEVLPRNSSMPNLKRLFLHRNGLTGTFPQSLSKSSSLEFLDVQHNSLSGELSTQFPALPYLRALLLGGNHFEGRIPLQVCQMKHLMLLDLSNNNLSGDIPSCFDNITSWTEKPSSERFEVSYYSGIAVSFWLKNRFRNLTRLLVLMKGIDMSSNQLTGTIPIEMGVLKNLRLINMSSNILTGQIPASLGNLRDLESLDLSDNRLSDAIPQELISLDFLSVFDVSFNNLSGALPERELQFATFENSSYIGNPGLCGPPLTKECIEKVEKSSCLYSKNMGSAYTMVFWCFIFLLYSL